MTHAASDHSHPERLRGRLDALLDRLAHVGALPTDDDETRLKKALTVLTAIVILPIAFTHADEFVLEPRGKVAVKGKGDIETWYLVGRRQPARPA